MVSGMAPTCSQKLHCKNTEILTIIKITGFILTILKTLLSWLISNVTPWEKLWRRALWISAFKNKIFSALMAAVLRRLAYFLVQWRSDYWTHGWQKQNITQPLRMVDHSSDRLPLRYSGHGLNSGTVFRLPLNERPLR